MTSLRPTTGFTVRAMIGDALLCETTVNSNGRYECGGVTSIFTAMDLKVSSTGQLPGINRTFSAESVVSAPAGEAATTSTLEANLEILETVVLIEGAVRFPDGQSTSNLYLEATGTNAYGATRTDATGKFQIYVSMPSTSARTDLHLTVKPDQNYSALFSQVLAVDAEKDRMVKVTKDLTATVLVIEGHLKKGNVGMQDYKIRVARATGGFLGEDQTDAQGHFRITYLLSQEEQTLNLKVTALEGQDLIASQDATLTIRAEELNTVTAELAATALKVSGVIKNLDGNVVPNATVSLSDAHETNTVSDAQGKYTLIASFPAATTSTRLRLNAVLNNKQASRSLESTLTTNTVTERIENLTLGATRRIKLVGALTNATGPGRLSHESYRVRIRSMADNALLCSTTTTATGEYSCDLQLAEFDPIPVRFEVDEYATAIVSETSIPTSPDSVYSEIRLDVALPFRTLKVFGTLKDAAGQGLAGIADIAISGQGNGYTPWLLTNADGVPVDARNLSVPANGRYELYAAFLTTTDGSIDANASDNNFNAAARQVESYTTTTTEKQINFEFENVPGRRLSYTPAPGAKSIATTADGITYVGGQKLSAFSVTGQTLWSTPLTASAQKVMIQSNGELLVMHAQGLERFNTSGIRLASISKPAISRLALGADDTIYVATASAIEALNPDGSQRWSLPITSSVNRLIVSGDGSIYASSNAELMALSATGERRWTRNFVVSGLAVDANANLIVNNLGRLVSLDANGIERWDSGTGSGSYSELMGDPLIGVDGTIYYSDASYSYTQIRAIHGDGQTKWNMFVNGGTTGMALGNDGVLYITNCEDSYRRSGTIRAIQPDGNTAWTKTGLLQSQGYYSSNYYCFDDLTVNQSGVLVLENNQLVTFKADASGLAQTAWNKIDGNSANNARGITYSGPAPTARRKLTFTGKITSPQLDGGLPGTLENRQLKIQLPDGTSCETQTVFINGRNSGTRTQYSCDIITETTAEVNATVTLSKQLNGGTQVRTLTTTVPAGTAPAFVAIQRDFEFPLTVAEITGHVVNPDNTPAPDAEISLNFTELNGPINTSADSTGDYRITIAVPDGITSLHGTITARGPTYYGHQSNLRVDQEIALNILENQINAKTLDLQFLPPGTLRISGRVTDLNAQPIADIRVYFSQYQYNDSQSVYSDSNGNYSMLVTTFPNGVIEQGYTLQVNEYGYHREDKPIAGTITAGQQLELIENFVLRGPTKLTIHGAVKDTAGDPISGASVKLQTVYSMYGSLYANVHATTNSNASGEYTLTYETFDESFSFDLVASSVSQQTTKHLTFTPSNLTPGTQRDQTEDLVLLGQTQLTVHGTVKDATGQLLSGATVELQRMTYGMYGPQLQTLASTTSNASGEYTMSYQTYDQNFEVDVVASNGLETDSRRFSYTPANLTPGTQRDETVNLSFALRPTVTISGTVQDTNGQPVENATISIFDAQLQPYPIATVYSSADGTYALEIELRTAGSQLRAQVQYGSSTESKPITVVTASDGTISSQTPINFSVTPPTKITISGFVKDQAGTAFSTGWLEVSSDASYADAAMDATGHYEMTLLILPGDPMTGFQLITHDDNGNQTSVQDLDLSATAPQSTSTREINITIQP
jgi:protocatechuate 3,4-dioxygenase beta subunit